MSGPEQGNPRGGALEILRRWSAGKKFAADLLENDFRRGGRSPQSRARMTALVNGVIRQKRELDWLIDRFSRKKAPSYRAISRQILRLALFELMDTEGGPDYAIVHQAGELADALLSRKEKGYVNAVLRTFLRKKNSLPYPPPTETDLYLSVTLSHPRWLLARWKRWMTSEAIEAVCRADNLPPPFFIRPNRLKTDGGLLEKELEKEGIEWQQSGEDDFYLIRPHRSIAGLDAFREGLFTVQDPATVRCARLLAARPGERIADLCAAPGGKTAVLAEMMENSGRLLAADSSQKRLKLLRENLSRLGIENAEVKRFDLLDPEGIVTGWDGILVDVPCSNTGVLRRRVDVRWRIREEDITRLAEQGGRLLRSAAGLLREGGRLVYSTCSLEREENGEVIRGFLDKEDGFTLEDEIFGLPQPGGADGYYAALLRKEKR